MTDPELPRSSFQFRPAFLNQTQLASLSTKGFSRLPLSTFKFSNFHLFLNRITVLNSRATGTEEHCVSTWFVTSPLAMAARVRVEGAPS